VLVTLLADPEKARVALKDLADIDRAREARRSRLAGRPPGDRPSTPAPQQGEDAAQWQYDRNCVIAYARAVCDGRGLKVAADELGVPIEQIGAMIRTRTLAPRARTRSCGGPETMTKKTPTKGSAKGAITDADFKPVMFPLVDLQLDPGNARRHDERNLAAITQSLQQFAGAA
jgi:hypothetical protein